MWYRGRGLCSLDEGGIEWGGIEGGGIKRCGIEEGVV